MPSLLPGRVLVKIEASGVCRTDVHRADGHARPGPAIPYIPGHEGAGYVSGVGRGVVGFKEGDRVGVPSLHGACGYCEQCLGGWEQLCALRQRIGHTVDGTHAQYMIADPEQMALLPDHLSFADAAPVVGAGLAAYRALRMLDCRIGDFVVVSGIGGVGHLAIQFALVMGFHVIAVDIQPAKLALARRLGATAAIDASAVDPDRELQRWIRGAHGVLVTAPAAAAFVHGYGMLRARGTLCMVGLPTQDVSVPILDAVVRGLTIRGSLAGNRTDLDDVLRFAADREVRPVYSVEPVEHINAVFDRLRANRVEGRVVLTMGD